eukprot:scaffold9004_cov112-Isochrysis_galbana.AAC.2
MRSLSSLPLPPLQLPTCRSRLVGGAQQLHELLLLHRTLAAHAALPQPPLELARLERAELLHAQRRRGRRSGRRAPCGRFPSRPRRAG